MAGAKKPPLHQFVAFFFAVEERRTDRALLPFEVASIPFDISLSVFPSFPSTAAASTAVSLFNLSSGIIGAEVTNDSKGKRIENESFVTTRAPRDSNARHFLNT
jgi:hypothetical protein